MVGARRFAAIHLSRPTVAGRGRQGAHSPRVRAGIVVSCHTVCNSRQTQTRRDPRGHDLCMS